MRRPTLDRPPRFEVTSRDAGRITLASDTAAIAHVFILEPDILRVLVLPDGRVTQPVSFAIAPGAEDVADSGRDRFDLDGFVLPAWRCEISGRQLVIETVKIRLTIELDGFRLAWEVFDGTWKRAACDRPTWAYDFGWQGGSPRHWLVMRPNELIFGLGEKSGDQNRVGRRFRMCNLDALGYSARYSDPLYKHLPFTITRRPAQNLCYGLFYDTAADCVLDLGCERDNYHGPYRAFEAEAGDLDYYFIAGPRLDQVVRRFTWLTGRPALMPAWSLGFSGSSMAIADSPDAEAAVRAYFDECQRRGIPCPSFHLSSGYTGGDGRRHVFTWDAKRFPDPYRFVAEAAARGVRLVANIKPALLTDHPLFAEARAQGLLIAETDGAPALTQFWGGLAGLIDFTDLRAAGWWREKLTSRLLDLGVAASWNDNNEFEIASPTARARGLHGPARDTRSIQPLLMMRASRAAQVARTPGKRPFVVSRSGSAGMQRYAQTWSGDNTTSWESLRYGLKMGLGLALSGVSNSGSDVGGFSGPGPDAELLCRWTELGVFMPRFSIHSWNDDGVVSSPWMHEAVAEPIAGLIRLRQRLIPYFQYLSWRYARLFEPIWRPLFYDFPDDPATWTERDDFMLGPDLLIAPVVEPGASERRVVPPAGAQWIDPWTGARHDGGRVATLPAPLGRPPVLGRIGGLIPLNLAPTGFGVESQRLGLLLFAPSKGESTLELLDDDGESVVDVARANPEIRIRVVCGARRIVVRARGLALDPGDVLVPPGEVRPVVVEP